MMKKIKKYLKSFWKYYILRKPKLILTMILTVVVFVMLNNILNEIMSKILFNDRELLLCRFGIFILFIKPIFIYIAGLVIIKKI